MIQKPKNLRVELDPYPHLRDDEGCVLARDFIHDEKINFIMGAVNSHALLIAAIQRAADMLPANAACGVLRAVLKMVENKGLVP